VSAARACILGLALLGCAAARPSSPPPAPGGTGHSVTGTLTYRERVALPADAEIHVVLADVSRQDVAATTIAETTLRPGGRQVPLPFELAYDPAMIEPSHTYALRATIRSGGRLAFTTTTAYRVVTGGNPTHADLLLTQVQAPAGGPPGTAWVLEDLAGAGVMDYVRATLEFPEPGKVAGNGSCNRFFGSAPVTGDRLTVSPLGATRMACPEAVMNQESRYFQALQAPHGSPSTGPGSWSIRPAWRNRCASSRRTDDDAGRPRRGHPASPAISERVSAARASCWRTSPGSRRSSHPSPTGPVG
jgi:putative lipoprotein